MPYCLNIVSKFRVEGTFDCLRKNFISQLCLQCLLLSLAALVPGKVQNLGSTLDINVPSLTLNWDKPSNVKTAEEVIAYDIRFRPAGSGWRNEMTVDSQYTSVVLTGEDGFNPLKTYDFQVRAWNARHCKGKWSKVSKYIGMFIYYSTNSVLLVI